MDRLVVLCVGGDCTSQWLLIQTCLDAATIIASAVAAGIPYPSLPYTSSLNPVPPSAHSSCLFCLSTVKSRLSVKEAVLRTMPIWLTVLLLLLTRIPALPIKRVLQR